MRIDKFLKVSRVLKRRAVAKELADHQRININGKAAKPSATVEADDIVDIIFGHRKLTIKVLEVMDHSRKKDAPMMYEILSETYIKDEITEENT